LDFTNTLTGWGTSPRDWIDSYERLIHWAESADLIDNQTGRALKKIARARPARADDAVDIAKERRLIIREYFVSMAQVQRPKQDRVNLLYAGWRESLRSLKPKLKHGQLILEVAAPIHLDVITDKLNYMAFELAKVIEVSRLRICDGDNCGWLFIDKSKAGRRRWCDMSTCGNVAKARRHSRGK
jgi:predicted RNA-binding Zn ribbon-like protein